MAEIEPDTMCTMARALIGGISERCFGRIIDILSIKGQKGQVAVSYIANG
ncbi:hypothetical protein [Novosphingobium panipatense]|nr:hypothetical protein [Novosphingobium panipatense]